MSLIPVPIVMPMSSSQFANAASPIFLTLFGMVMEVMLVQLSNADFPMLVTLLPIIMEVRPVQYENALSADCQQFAS